MKIRQLVFRSRARAFIVNWPDGAPVIPVTASPRWLAKTIDGLSKTAWETFRAKYPTYPSSFGAYPDDAFPMNQAERAIMRERVVKVQEEAKADIPPKTATPMAMAVAVRVASPKPWREFTAQFPEYPTRIHKSTYPATT